MDIFNDSRYVLTLDAGGTNFVFSAMRGGDQVVTPSTFPAHGENLDKCLKTILMGFEKVMAQLPEAPAAISFAFPGPADYPQGIIGDLGNLPAFRGGVPLGPILREHFKIPVFINNDGDLFAYGEAIGGFLPVLNRQMEKTGNPKRYRNLLGITLGTGFGAGFVNNGSLYIGDNSAGAEIWLIRNMLYPKTFAEEGSSIRAVVRAYRKYCNAPDGPGITPKDIFEIAAGRQPGDRNAARKSFEEMGVIVGDALANAVTLLDCPVVIGGGLSEAAALFLPILIEEMNSKIGSYTGRYVQRMESTAFNFEDPAQRNALASGNSSEIPVYGTNKKILYDPDKRIPVGLTKLGTSRAVALGAYAFAVSAMNK